MAVGIKVGTITDEIGTSEFLHAFFSTICANCEGSVWGARYPILMKKLYAGSLSSEEAKIALGELSLVKIELSKTSISSLVWDIEDKSRQPPWGSNISPSITNLGNYFITSTGRDLISTLQEALEAAASENKMAEIVNY